MQVRRDLPITMNLFSVALEPDKCSGKKECFIIEKRSVGLEEALSIPNNFLRNLGRSPRLFLECCVSRLLTFKYCNGYFVGD